MDRPPSDQSHQAGPLPDPLIPSGLSAISVEIELAKASKAKGR